MKKVGIDIREATGARAGKGVYVFELVKALAKQPADQTQFILYTKNPHAQKELGFELPDHMQIICVQAPALLWHILVAFRAKFIDHVAVFVALTSYIIPAIIPKKSIVAVHDLYALLTSSDMPEAQLHNKKASIIERLTAKRAFTKSRHLLSVSHFTKSELVRMFAIESNKITVVSPACDTALANQKGALSSDHQSQLENHANFVLYLGTIEPRKDILTLLQAMEKIPNKTLVLAGKRGWNTQAIDSEIERLNMHDRVVWLGYVQDSEKYELYRRAICFVFPSVYEGFGIPPLEAMAAGCPVVTTKAASLPEVVQNAGLLVEPQNPSELAGAISSLITNKKLRDEFRIKGLARSAQYSWENSAKQLRMVINEYV